jgi:RNA polymerase sigma-70 factor, ECF subfamily
MSLALVKSPGETKPARRVPVGQGGVDEDEDLVRRAQAGDEGAFAALFGAHHGRIFGLCSRLLAGRDVEDTVQQTFLEAWRCLHRFEGRSRFSTWLVRIAIHTCYSTRRRLRRALLLRRPPQEPQLALVTGGTGHGSGPDDGTDGAHHPSAPLRPDEQLGHRVQEDALRQALLALSEKKRVAFVLSDLEGHTSPEVAEILGVPEATVRTRLFYARREVVAALRDHPAFARLAARDDAQGKTR